MEGRGKIKSMTFDLLRPEGQRSRLRCFTDTADVRNTPQLTNGWSHSKGFQSWQNYCHQ